MSNSAEESLSARDMFAIADRERADAERRLTPDDRLLYFVWGAAWSVGFTALWLTSGDAPRVDASTAAGWLYAAAMVAALVVTVLHTLARTSGIRGRSKRIGTRYGVTWGISFMVFAMILVGLGRAEVPDAVFSLLSPVLPVFIVGVMYMAGGAVWDDRLQYVLGGWIAVLAGVATIVGDPQHLLALAVGGGGAFFVAAGVAAVRTYARS